MKIGVVKVQLICEQCNTASTITIDAPEEGRQFMPQNRDLKAAASKHKDQSKNWWFGGEADGYKAKCPACGEKDRLLEQRAEIENRLKELESKKSE